MSDPLQGPEAGPVFAGVELGGTKVVCGLARRDGSLLERASIATREPGPTLDEVRDVLAGWSERYGPPAALGAATFGPIELDEASQDYGLIGHSPKVLWRGVRLTEELTSATPGPVVAQTDVNGAALGEARWGAGEGVDPLVYITVGTGIGGGVLVGGRALTGVQHPELGHMYVPRAPEDLYEGGCANHGDCVEGLAAGPSIVARWGANLSELPDGHAAYRLIAHYVAHLVVNVVLTVAPQRVILGGGVMSNEGLFPPVRRRVIQLLGGFFAPDAIEGDIERYIVPPALGGNAGVLGAAALAMDAVGAG